MDYDTDEDDQDLGVAPVLPVGDDNETYELDLPPVDGMDFLRRVRMEAKACPATVSVELCLPQQQRVVNVKDSLLSRSSAITGQQLTICSPAPQGYAPSIEWQNHQVAQFSQVRMKLAEYLRLNKMQGKKKKAILQNLPPVEDAESWCRFCFGEVKANSQNINPSDNAGSEQGSQSPLLSLIAAMSQDMVIQVLEHHINYYECRGFSYIQGQWFYALLAALEKPLLPEACSLLRTLARMCSNLRASLMDNTDKLLPQLNLIICLVGQYFSQSDLADHPS